MSGHEAVVTTEIDVTGANCPFCFNETMDRLRVEPGVVAVHGSTAEQCFRIDHDGVELDRLVSLVRQHLHGDDVSSDEHVMVEVDPRVAEQHCTHGHGGSTVERPETAGDSSVPPPP